MLPISHYCLLSLRNETKDAPPAPFTLFSLLSHMVSNQPIGDSHLYCCDWEKTQSCPFNTEINKRLNLCGGSEVVFNLLPLQLSQTRAALVKEAPKHTRLQASGREYTTIVEWGKTNLSGPMSEFRWGICSLLNNNSIFKLQDKDGINLL